MAYPRTPTDEVRAYAKKLAASGAGEGLVTDVLIEDAFGPGGAAALLVRVVTRRKTRERETLELTYRVFSGLTEFLEERGDDRRPTISFVRQSDLAQLKSEK
jgi:hypothetical protein